MKIIKLDMLQNSPMLDNRGEEAKDTEENKTQSKNQSGVKVSGVSDESGPRQNIVELSDAKSEPNQREAGADPGHEGTVGSLARTLFG